MRNYNNPVHKTLAFSGKVVYILIKDIFKTIWSTVKVLLATVASIAGIYAVVIADQSSNPVEVLVDISQNLVIEFPQELRAIANGFERVDWTKIEQALDKYLSE